MKLKGKSRHGTSLSPVKVEVITGVFVIDLESFWGKQMTRHKNILALFSLIQITWRPSFLLSGGKKQIAQNTEK